MTVSTLSSDLTDLPICHRSPPPPQASSVEEVFHLDLAQFEIDWKPVSEPVLVQHNLDNLEPVGLFQPK